MDHVELLLQKYGQNDQRTDAWHTKRGEMLTASEIHKACKDASPAARHEIILSKLVPRERGTVGSGPKALLWGTRFEPIAKLIYTTYYQGGIEIVDTTCVPHPVHSFLGASPDGIIVTKDKNDFRYGKLVEFKCPISREFSDTSPIPEAYYHQMQLQLECTGMQECEYIEMKFREVNYSEWVDSKAQYKSFFIVFQDGEVVYKDIEDKRDVPTWRREVLDEKDDRDFSTTYWYFDTVRMTSVPHDPMWLSTNLESFTSVWNTIQEHRKNGTLPENPKDKTTLVL
jgi:putative phage-type endonuclease